MINFELRKTNSNLIMFKVHLKEKTYKYKIYFKIFVVTLNIHIALVKGESDV